VTKRRILNPATTGTITLEEARALIREFQRERSEHTQTRAPRTSKPSPRVSTRSSDNDSLGQRVRRRLKSLNKKK
jgi:hypothetical protein